MKRPIGVRATEQMATSGADMVRRFDRRPSISRTSRGGDFMTSCRSCPADVEVQDRVRDRSRQRPIAQHRGGIRFLPMPSPQSSTGKGRPSSSVASRRNVPCPGGSRGMRRRAGSMRSTQALPGSTDSRFRRERNGAKGRTAEIERLIARSLRAAIDLEALGPLSLVVDCDVLNADGECAVCIDHCDGPCCQVGDSSIDRSWRVPSRTTQETP